VIYQDDGSALTEGLVQGYVRRAAQRAGLFNNGMHMLRHHADSRIMPTLRSAVLLALCSPTKLMP
jgi:hypothetical protein